MSLAVWMIAGPALGADLSVLEAQLERFPDDYASAAALGKAAVQAGDGELALRGWRAAQRVSGGNLESSAGVVLALTALGRHIDARAAAEALVVAHPDSAKAWVTHAWAWRWEPILPQRSAWQATRSYQMAAAAARVQGGGSELWCGLGYTRWSLGDIRRSREAFEASDSVCGRQGLASMPPVWRVWGSAAAGLAAYADHPWRASGRHVGGQVGARWSEAVGVDLSVRRVTVDGAWPDDSRPPPDRFTPPPLEEDTVGQTELWARTGGRVGTVGGDALVGVVQIDGAESGSAHALGGRAWAQLSAVTLGLSAVSTSYDSGDNLQLGADLELPLHAAVALMGGVDHTRAADQVTTAAGPTGPVTSELLDQGSSGWGAVRAAVWPAGLSLSLGGRLGRELRPVRFAVPAVWNLDEALLGSGFADISWRLDDHFTLFGGLERVRLEDPLPDAPHSLGEGKLTTGHLGLRLDLGPRPKETR